MGTNKRKPTPGSEPPVVEVPELPERWSAARKTELVMRLLRGEALDAVSRESQVQDRGIDDAVGAGRGPHRKKGLRGRVEEARAMKGRVSPGTQRLYPLTMICAVYRVPRSSVYAAGAPPSSAAGAKKPGPKTRSSDSDVLDANTAVCAPCP